MKKPSKAVCAALLAGSLVACSVPEAPEIFPSPTPGASRTVVVWLIRDDRTPQPELIRRLQQDSSRFDKVTVRVEMVPRADVVDRLERAHQAGWSPDVVEVPAEQTLLLADKGLLTDLAPAIEEWGITNDLMVSMRTAAAKDDAIYALPFSITPRAFVYNQEIFARAGITEPPNDWQGLVRAAEQISQTHPEMTPWPVSAAEPDSFYPFVLATGAKIVTKDAATWRSDLDTAPAVDALTRYASRIDSNNPTASDDQIAAAIADEKAAMAVLNSQSVREIIKRNSTMDLKLGVFPVPGDDGHAAPIFVESTQLVIPAGSKYPYNSWKTARRIGTGEWAIAWNQRQGSYAGMKSLLDQQLENATSIERPFIRPIVERGLPKPPSSGWAEVESSGVISTMLESVATGRRTPQEAADDAAAQVTQLLAGK